MSAPTNDPLRVARVRAAMRSGMTELAAQELADRLEAPKGELGEAFAIIGELIDWFGAPDWDGPTLPTDLGRRINRLLSSALPDPTPIHRKHPHVHMNRCLICYRPWPCPHAPSPVPSMWADR